MARIRLSHLTKGLLLGGALGAATGAVCGLSTVGLLVAGLTLVAAAFALSEAVEAGRMAYHAVEECASELNLTPLGTPTTAARRAARLGEAAVARVEKKSILLADNPPTE